MAGESALAVSPFTHRHLKGKMGRPPASVRSALLGLFSWLAVLGCGSGTEPDTIDYSTGLCRSVGDPSSYGCVGVEGVVSGAHGQPLSGIIVSTGPLADGGRFNGVAVTTDSAGRFAFRLFQYGHGDGNLDSVSLWIRAVLVPTQPPFVVTVQDSVMVRAMVAIPGIEPVPTHATVTLPGQ